MLLTLEYLWFALCMFDLLYLRHVYKENNWYGIDIPWFHVYVLHKSPKKNVGLWLYQMSLRLQHSFGESMSSSHLTQLTGVHRWSNKPNRCPKACSRAAWNCNNFFTLGRGKLWWKTPKFPSVSQYVKVFRIALIQDPTHIFLEDTPDVSPTVYVSEFLSLWGFYGSLGYLPRGPVGKIIDLRIGTSIVS